MAVSFKEPKFHIEILRDYEMSENVMIELEKSLNLTTQDYFICPFNDNTILVTDNADLSLFFEVEPNALGRRMSYMEAHKWLEGPRTLNKYRGNLYLAEHVRTGIR